MAKEKTANRSTIYLDSISLHNFATFQQEDVTFSPEFTSLIGETGAGKSLIITALQMVLGGRADKKWIRSQCEFASIEAFFHSSHPEVSTFFNEIGFPFEDDTILIKRIIYRDGQTKNYVNFQSCSLKTIQRICSRFVDVVGQHENQKLLNPQYQVKLLDQYAKNDDLVSNYVENLEQYKQVKERLKELQEQKNNHIKLEDYLRFQIGEIEKISPSSEEEEQLILKKEQIQSEQAYRSDLQRVQNLITSEESSGAAMGNLQFALSILDHHSELELFANKIKHVLADLEDLSYQLAKFQDQDDGDESLDEILDRLDSYQKLKRKFGGDISTVLDQYTEFKNQLQDLDQVDEKIKEYQNQITQIESDLNGTAKILFDKRTKNAKILSKQLTQSIRHLNMPYATCDIQLEKVHGYDINAGSKIQFLVETNPGQGYHKLSDIASGGELSRILLCLRSLLASKDSISIFLFDEIDTGIGGKTALTVGKLLQDLCQKSQVIVITHLAQIAQYSQKIISIEKNYDLNKKNKDTQSHIFEATTMSEKEKLIREMTPLN